MSTPPEIRPPQMPPAERPELTERLAEPEVAEALHRLLDRLDRVEAMVDALGTFGQRLPVIAEALGDGSAWAFEEARARGIEPVEAGQRAGDLALKAAQPEMMDLVERLLEQAPTLGKALDALDQIDDRDVAAVTTALVETRNQPTQLVTPFMALFKLSDPDIQRTIGFSLEFAKRLGRILRSNDPE